MTPSQPPRSTRADTLDSTVAPPSTTLTRSMSSISAEPPRLAQHDKEERGAQESRHDPERHLSRRQDGAGKDVSQYQETGAEQKRKRDDAAVARAGDEPD